jgi:hypothetical protein
VDIYRELAASILGKPAAEVTGEERSRAKQAFWAAFEQVAKLPDNEHLLAGLATSGSRGMQYSGAGERELREEQFGVRTAPLELPPPAMLYIGSGPDRRRFSCERCGVNVFTPADEDFLCNGCGTRYGDPGRPS